MTGWREDAIGHRTSYSRWSIASAVLAGSSIPWVMVVGIADVVDSFGIDDDDARWRVGLADGRPVRHQVPSQSVGTVLHD
jgi:hypothetical protein